MKIAIYAGTFDPITNGHLDIIERAAELFDLLIVAVAKNPSKQPLFELEQRVELVKASTTHLKNVQAVGFSGLLAKFAEEQNANVLVRGIRGADDVEYEIQLAQLSQQLSNHLQTIFLPPSAQWRFLSSTIVREVYKHGGDVSHFVPNVVFQQLKQL